VSQVLQPYLKYKSSGLTWQDEIPSHWDEKRAKYFFREIDERSNNGLEERLSVSHITGVTPRSQKNVTMFEAESNVNHKICHPGDLVINTMWAWMAALGVAKQTGIVSPSYAVYRPISSKVFVDGYIDHLLRTEPYATEYLCSSTGIHSSRLRLYPEKFLEIPIICPPYLEQIQMLAFLNFRDQLIRRYIRAKQKLIRLLEEQKQAIIHRAVTRGLDPSVPLKPSGVEWLGDVPEHWDVVSLRRRWMVKDCKHLTVPFFEQGIPLASVREAQSFELRLDSCNRTTEEWYNQLIEGGRRPQIGDLIYCRNVSVGACAIVTQDDVFALGQDVCLIRSTKENQRWFNYYLHSKAMADQLALILVGSTFHRINLEDIKALIVPVPPRFEQDQISNYLDKELKQIEDAIAFCLQQQIILREYRARLISDVVTGKLDVRGVNLPDAEDIETPKEYSDLLESEEIMEEDLQEEIPAEGDCGEQ